MLDVVLRFAVILVVFLVLPLIVGQTEHKVMAHMQSRLGPMYAGGFHGWAQLIADGVKFVQKEDVIPAAADRRIFMIAPGVALVPYLRRADRHPDRPRAGRAWTSTLGLFFVLAVMGIGVLGSIMAGWASANKYSVLGGMRSAAQLMSYELPLVLAASSRRDGRGHAVAARHRRGVAVVVAALAGDRRRGVLHGRAGRAAPAAVRHADRRVRDHHGPDDRVHRDAVRPVHARRVRRDRRAVRS